MTAPSQRILGVIGGSGLYELDALVDRQWRRVPTAFGEPSDQLLFGTLGGQQVVFLPRHGRGHRFSPTEVNYRANIAALKSVGVTDVLSVSAVGSLREDLTPGTFVIPDQYIDRTFAREKTFFGDGVTAHVSMAHPVCGRLGESLATAAKGAELRVVRGGTYLVMEGPQFSTLAESRLYRSWGCDVIGMTNMPEAKLAREAELCYASVAMVTDFDCWHPSHGHVTVADVVRVLSANAQHARTLVGKLAPLVQAQREACSQGCGHALESAVITSPDARPAHAVERLLGVARRVLSTPPPPERAPAEQLAEHLKSRVRTIPDFPRKGIQFRDITTLLQDGEGLRLAIDALAARYADRRIDKIAGIEARGFILGAALAYKLGIGFVPLRKKGKLPGPRIGQAYALEYGDDEIELHLEAIRSGERVVVVDDLLATGGTAEAALRLVHRGGGQVEEVAVVIELPDLHGRQRLAGQGCAVHSLCSFHGE